MKRLWHGNGIHPFFVLNKNCMEIKAIGTRGQGVIPPLKVLAVLKTKHSESKCLVPPPPIFSDIPKSLDLKLGQPTFYD